MKRLRRSSHRRTRLRRAQLVVLGIALATQFACSSTTHRVRVESDVVGAEARVATVTSRGRGQVWAPRPTPAEFQIRAPRGKQNRSAITASAIVGALVTAGGVGMFAAGASDQDGGVGSFILAGSGGVVAATGGVIALVALVAALAAPPEIEHVEVSVTAPDHAAARQRISLSPQLLEQTVFLEPEPSPKAAPTASEADAPAEDVNDGPS